MVTWHLGYLQPWISYYANYTKVASKNALTHMSLKSVSLSVMSFY